MKMLICAVYDAAVGAYMQPIYVRSKAEAIRSFADAVGKDGSPFCTNPGDYSLFCLGGFDDNSGNIDAVLAPEKLITALECRAQRQD